MKYKVYDTIARQYVAEDTNMILKPDGKLAINEYGDEIGISNCIALFFPTEDESYYFDDIGGIHISGTGRRPDGTDCGRCSGISCSICGEWNRSPKDYLYECYDENKRILGIVPAEDCKELLKKVPSVKYVRGIDYVTHREVWHEVKETGLWPTKVKGIRY